MTSEQIEEAFKPLRTALRPKGTANLTWLTIKPGTLVDGDLPQKAIDEIIHYVMVEKMLGEEETACMKLAKMILMDSGYQ